MGANILSSGASLLTLPSSPEFGKLKCDEGWALHTRKRLCAAVGCRITPIH